MADRSARERIAEIAASSARIVVRPSGPGSEVLIRRLAAAGAAPPTFDVAAAEPTAAPSGQQAARHLAMTAFHDALLAVREQGLPIGMGCLFEQGADSAGARLHIALQTADLTEAVELALDQGEPSGDAMTQLALQIVSRLAAAACGLEQRTMSDRPAGVRLLHCRKEAATGWSDLLLGQVEAIMAAGEVDWPTLVFPGAFNPFHHGHEGMAEVAQQMLSAPLVYELSLMNVDKPPLDFLEIERRLVSLADKPTWLTRSATFVEKSDLFPGATFVVGADTMLRIADPKYYDDNPDAAAAAIDHIVRRGCRFLVFGRLVDDQFLGLADFNLPAPLRAICQDVPADTFRIDVSSTELRHKGQ